MPKATWADTVKPARKNKIKVDTVFFILRFGFNPSKK